jgi:hypothetical protein
MLFIRPVALGFSDAPPSTLGLHIDSIGDLHQHITAHFRIPSTEQLLAHPLTGQFIHDADLAHLLLASQHQDMFVDLRLRLCGGKGGFGANLKSMGNRLARRHQGNYDSCRDLNGRRLRTIAAAKELADAKEQAEHAKEERRKQLEEKVEQDLQAVERYEEQVKRMRFDDGRYFEEKDELVEGVRDAVKIAMKEKKMKKGAKVKQEDEKVEPPALLDDDISSSSSSDTEQ